jgi:protein TonB
MLLLLVLAQAASQNPIVVSEERADPVSLYSAADYPPQALRNGWEGDVSAELTISPAGRATACRIVQSSGHDVLDKATCDILIKRARFKPATDSKGIPVEDHFLVPKFRWRLGH